MGQRSLINAAEQLQVMRHLADVAALKDTPPAQRQLLIDGLNAIFKTTFGWLIVADDCRAGRQLKPIHTVLTSNPDAVWMRYCADFAVHVPPSRDMLADTFMRCDDIDQQLILSRVVPDAATRRQYAPAVAVAEQAGISEGAICGARMGPNGDRLVGFSLFRTRGDPPMRARDYALHRFALAEFRRLIDRGQFPLGEAVPSLPPRLQQVLAALLAGKPPKQMARTLGLSVHTIREHVQRLYTHFGVSGRDELMARFVNTSQ